jgi:hypothetical protein
MLQNSKVLGGIGIQNVETKIQAFRLMFLIRLSKCVGQKWFHYFNEKFIRLKSIDETSQEFLAFLPIYRELYSVEKLVRLHYADNHTIIFFKPYVTDKIDTKFLYNILTEKKVKAHREKLNTMWCAVFTMPNFSLIDFAQNNFLKFADGYTSDIHYLLTNNALFTRHRVSKWNRNITQYCKFCENHNRREKETNMHALLYCHRASDFWNKLSRFLLNEGQDVTMTNKIFGFNNTKDPNWFNYNLIIQISQKAIWMSRNDLENKEILTDIWKLFKNLLVRIFKRILRFTLNDKVSQLILKLNNFA